MPRARLALLFGMLVAAGILMAACPKTNGYQAVRVFPHVAFERMLGMYPIPGEGAHAAIVTQGGVIYRANLANSSEAPTVYLDLRGSLIGSPGEEEGLLGLAFAPDFAQSRRLYVYYTAGNPRRSVIERFSAPGAAADPASRRVILEVPQPRSNHNGGAMAFGPDGRLYIALGDGGGSGDPEGNGQNRNTLLGAILRIDVSGDGYSIPGDNPFAGGGGRGEIWAYGFRNPWRISFDPETGQLWTGDVGQGRWEEVDRVIRGGNYGWNILEGHACYGASTCNRAGLIPPRVTYGHEYGCSITGGYVYHGSAMPELRGWYVYGDYCSGRVWAVHAGTDAGAAIPLAETNVSISSFAVGPDGELYIVSFNRAIYRLVRKS